MHKIQARLVSVEQRPNTPSGNPAWRVTVRWTDYGGLIAYDTAPDSQAAKELNLRWEGEPVEMSINDMGKIVSIALW